MLDIDNRLSRAEEEFATTGNIQSLALLVQLRNSLSPYISSPNVSLGHFERAATLLLKIARELKVRNEALESANVLEDLAEGFLGRRDGHRAKFVENALTLLELSIGYSRDNVDLVTNIRRLVRRAVAYRDRLLGDSTENLKLSALLLEEATQLYEANKGALDALSYRNAKAAHTIAGIFAETAGTRRRRLYRNIPQEIELTQKALALTPRNASFDNAMLHNALSVLYLEAAQRKGDEVSYEAARTHAITGIKLIPQGSQLRFYLLINLALVYARRRRGSKQNNLQLAIENIKQALSYTAPPLDKAGAFQNLGTAYEAIEPWLGPRALKRAVHAFRMARRLRIEHHSYAFALQSTLSLGSIFHRVGRNEEAREVLQDGDRLLSDLRESTVKLESHKMLASLTRKLYDLLVSSWVRKMDAISYEVAALYASRGKHHMGAIVLGKDRKILSDLSKNNSKWPELLQEFWDRTDELHSLFFWAAEDSLVTPGELQEARLLLSVAWLEFGNQNQLFDWSGGRSKAHDLGASVFAAATSDFLIEFVSHSDGWGAFISGGVLTRYVDLPGLEDLQFTELLSRRPSRGIAHSTEGTLDLDYSDALQTLERLYELAIAPLQDFLPIDVIMVHRLLHGQRPRLILAPDKGLHATPLIGALRAIRRPWTDALEPTLMQSLSVFKFESRRLAKQVYAGKHEALLLSIAYAGPDPRHPKYLNGVEAEARTVAQYFSSDQLCGTRATMERAVDLSSRCTYLHFASHGIFANDFPSQSGILLADGVLSAQRIMATMKLDSVRLVTLGICHGGMMSASDAEDVTGIVQAFLTAGAGAVISNLWTVDDEASQDFFAELYKLLAEGQSIPVAMEGATAALRSQPRWQHPYFWAGFTLHGLAS